jgi:peptide/nickel transport system permease protein
MSDLAAETALTAPRIARKRGTWLRRHPTIVLGATILAVIVLAAVFASIVAPQDPLAMDPIHRLRPPDAAHWFGTDALGRDVFSRTLHGGRVSLLVGIGVATLATLIGVTIGTLAGWVRWLEPIIMRLVDAMMSIPGILLAIALVSINRPTPPVLIAAIALPEIPRVVRLTRAVVLTIRGQPYVEAAITSGTRPAALLLRHILPNAVAPVIVQATFICALAIILEATLSFLGAGSPPEVPSWGNIIASGRIYIRTAPWIILYPGLALALTVLSINLLGDGLRDMMDPRLRRALR